MKNPYTGNAEFTPEEFEAHVESVIQTSGLGLSDFQTSRRKKIEGLDGEYEIDVTAKFSALETDFLVLIECKHHKNPIKREVVQVLNDRVRSVGAQKGMIFSTARFQKGAIEYAQSHGIALVKVTDNEPEYFNRSGDQLAFAIPTRKGAWLITLSKDGNPTYSRLGMYDPNLVLHALGLESEEVDSNIMRLQFESLEETNTDENLREGFYRSDDGEWIPDGWNSRSLLELTTKIGSGATPRGGKDAYKQEGISLIRSQNILDLKFEPNGLAFIDDERAHQLANVEIVAEDVLINITGDSVARVCRVPSSVLPARVNQHVAIVRADEDEAHSRFLEYMLVSRANKGDLLGLASAGATRNALTKGMLEGFTRAIPPLPEQKAIADALGSLDDKIELLRKQNETLEALAQTLFKRWFIDFNFPDENGNPYKDSGGKMIASEFGKIPEGWKVGNFEDDGFCLTMGQSPSGSSYNEDGSGTLFFQGRAEFGWRFPTPRLFTTEPSRMANEGDILLSVRAPVGDINLAMQSCCVGRGLCAISHQFSSYGLYKVKSLSHFFDQYNQEGTVFGSISKKDFQRPELLIPNGDLVSLFEQLAAPLDVKIKSNTQQIETLTRLRDTLLPKLMKGEIRIKN